MILISLKLTRSSSFWLTAFLLWAVSLYILSSFAPSMPAGVEEFSYVDKIAHFGYFFGGGIILTNYLLLKKKDQLRPITSFAYRFILPLLTLSIIGALDEFHQTFTPGRTGNDLPDWLADTLGATTGIFVVNHLGHQLKKINSMLEKKSSD